MGKKDNVHTDIFHSVQTNGSCGNVIKTVCVSVIVVSKRWNVYLKVVIIYREILQNKETSEIIL